MPAPAVYVIAVVGSVAAAVAFKEFVYDPHIVPAFEQWHAKYAANRARRRQRREPSAVDVSQRGDDHTSSGTELRSLRPKRGSDAGEEKDDTEEKRSDELEKMVAREVDEWRSGVDRSQAGLRHRKNNQSGSTALEDSNSFLPYTPISPTHIVFDFTAETSPTSTHPSTSHSAIRVAGPPSTVTGGAPSSTPGSPMSSVRPSDSVSAVGQETPQMSPQMQPRSLSFTYDARALSLSPPIIVSPTLPTPAPSSPAFSSRDFVVRPSHPQGLGLDLFPASASSSRPDTPFSSLSSPGSAGSYDFASPRNPTLSFPTSPALAQSNSRTLSDVDPADFLSAISHTPSRTVSELDFLSAVGDEDFDISIMRPTAGSNTSSVAGDDFDLGSDISDGDSWSSVSQPRQ